MRFNCHSINCKRHSAERGSAVLVVVILLGIMTTLVVANSRTLYYLHRDLKLIDQQQQRRFEKVFPTQPPATNEIKQSKAGK